LEGVTAPTKPSADVNTRPERVSPLEIYKTIIIPDLEFAAQWLPITNVTTIPSKKSAMGFWLAPICKRSSMTIQRHTQLKRLRFLKL
jgi:hypothetical protein